MLASVAAYAQCPTPLVYPPPPAKARAMASGSTESSLQEDLRSSIAAQKNGKCQDHKLFQRRALSKEEREELRRVVREHAKSNPMHSGAERDRR